MEFFITEILSELPEIIPDPISDDFKIKIENNNDSIDTTP